VEIAFNQPIHSTPPPVPPHQRLPVQPRTPKARKPATLSADDNDDIFVNTADDEVGDGNIAAVLIASSDDVTDAGSGLPETDSRDYSLDMPATANSGPAIAFQQGAPAVPNSSFSFQYTTGDSSRPEEQLLYLQLSAQHEVLAAIARLQQETAAQLRALADLQAKATESVHLRQEIQTRQQKLQREYLKKITSWQKKLETTAHIRMIVYI
jgi:hypothetical protein